MENTEIGPFHVAERLGQNRRQRVFRATHSGEGLEVALKLIRIPDAADKSKADEKIQIEVELLKQLRHRHLVKILDAGIVEDQIFIATELIDGESLSTALSRKGKFAPDQVVEFGRQIAKLLDYLHDKDIIHSKLTPDKILITANGKIKVCDLRLNRSRKKRWDTVRQKELDIAAYMAPEQQTEGATTKSDIYSLGVILYEMLTGKLPYEPDTIGRMTRKKMAGEVPSVSRQVMNCPVWLDKIVCQMIDPEPKLRPHTANVIILAMDELRIMEQNKKAAVSQVRKGFTPLSIGEDRAEANRLLGPRERWQFDPAIFQSTGFMIVSLILVLGVITLALWPESQESKFNRATILMRSDEPADWRKARSCLKEFVDLGTGELFAPAEELYFESRRRTLLVQAERGRVMGLQSPNTQLFIKAYQLHSDNDCTAAAVIYRELIDSIELDGEERYIRTESAVRLEDCLATIGDQQEPVVNEFGSTRSDNQSN